MREVDKHSLVRRVQASVPTDPRRNVVNAEGNQHNRPFDATKKAFYQFGIDFYAGGIEWPIAFRIDGNMGFAVIVIGVMRRRSKAFGFLHETA